MAVPGRSISPIREALSSFSLSDSFECPKKEKVFSLPEGVVHALLESQ
jgi:hypothetical protein